MSGNLEAVLGPAALRFLRPIRVVGGGGGSYLGLSFCRGVRTDHTHQDCAGPYLLILVIASITTRATAHVRLLITLFDGKLVQTAQRTRACAARITHHVCRPATGTLSGIKAGGNFARVRDALSRKIRKTDGNWRMKGMSCQRRLVVAVRRSASWSCCRPHVTVEALVNAS